MLDNLILLHGPWYTEWHHLTAWFPAIGVGITSAVAWIVSKIKEKFPKK